MVISYPWLLLFVSLLPAGLAIWSAVMSIYYNNIKYGKDRSVVISYIFMLLFLGITIGLVAALLLWFAWVGCLNYNSVE